MPRHIGIRWGGHSLAPSLRPSVNAIAGHCFYTISCLDILSAICAHSSENNVVQLCDLRATTEFAVRNVRMLAVEKFGVCPEIVISGKMGRVPGIPSVLEYCLVELLKNSVRGMLDRYGALNVEEAEPIAITFSSPENTCSKCNAKEIDRLYSCCCKICASNAASLVSVNHQGGEFVCADFVSGNNALLTPGSGFARGRIEIVDSGCGIEAHVLPHIFDGFFTTLKAAREPTYTYSRDFGVPFAGKGFGLLRASTYLSVHEASLGVASVAGQGTTTRVDFQRVHDT